MTVEIKSQKSKSDTPANDAAARAPGLMDVVNVDPLQQGQALLAANKKRKKQQKRAGVYIYIGLSLMHHHCLYLHCIFAYADAFQNIGLF